MPGNSNRLFQFWQEMRRRKVVRVIPVYAAAAFVILQVADMTSGPLNLPEWTLPFLIVLLIIGFIVAVILSWAYDITPKGIEKTKPIEFSGEPEERRYLTDRGALKENSIVVLPFENMSSDPGQDYFSDGLTEEIITDLSHVHNLLVISRSSSMTFKGSKKKSTEIASEVNVKYVLEGSVRKAGNNMKITAQLIDGLNDTHLWAEKYNGTLDDIFQIQEKVAQSIVDALKLKLTPEEIRRIDKKPTQILEAYNYYLHGNKYYWQSEEKQDYVSAIIMYEKAIELDPRFALAYARLSICYSELYWFYYNRSPDQLIKSKAAVDEAFRIDPELPEVHIAMGFYYYEGFLNYPKALEHFEIASEKMQNSSECLFMKANIYRRAGNWILAMDNYLKASELDPGSPTIASNTAETFYLLGEFPEAEKYYDKTFSLNPSFLDPYREKSLMYMKWKGNTEQARATISNADKFIGTSPNPLLTELFVILDIYDGNYQKALSRLSETDSEIFEDLEHFNLKSLIKAHIFNLINIKEGAYSCFSAASLFLEERIISYPDDSRLYSSLGIAYAGLGKKEKAKAAGKKAVELMPVKKEAWRGVLRLEDLAKIYVMTGDYNSALKLIRQLLSLPGPLSPGLLKLDPVWRPLHNQPELLKILKDQPDSKNISKKAGETIDAVSPA
jgi:TolB-like protein/Flp pilus assembly protein TadD